MVSYNCVDGNNIFQKEFYTQPTPELLEQSLKMYQEGVNTIWVFDGKNSREQRQKFFPEYKSKDKDNELSQDQLDMYALKEKFMTEIIPTWGGVVLCFDSWEADDIIWNLVRFLNISKVHSTDKDFWQMLRKNPNLQLPETGALEADWKDVILYKTLVGDSADNIKGLRTFGQASWEKLDPAQVEILTDAFEKGADYAPDVGDTKLNEKLANSWKQLKIYYKAVKFIDLTEEDFAEMVVSRLKL